MHNALLLSFLMLVGCSSATDPISSPGFALYRLQDTKIAASQIWNQPLESMTLASSPFLTMQEMISYDWKTHTMTVTGTADSQFVQLARTLGPVGGIPFVVVVGTERIYLGAFWYPHSSLIPQVPFIDILAAPHQICRCPNGADARTDSRIYQALKRAGVLIE
jgi:hypothetical protein